MKAISVMLKPASSMCNLRCKYCFYHSLSEKREQPSHGFMSVQTLKSTLQKAFEFADGGAVNVSFQGGEPLLAGKSFFYEAADLIDALNVKRSPVNVGVQTNGTLLDEEWCAFLRKRRWLVGLSLDGDEAADALRIDADGNPTFERVFASAKLLQKNKVDFNILCVVTKPVAQRINAVYSFFRKHGFKYLQFIPMLKPLKLDAGGLPVNEVTYGEPFLSDDEDFSLSGEDYSVFLQKAFSLYLKDFIDGRYTSVRQFDNFVRLARSQNAEQCGMDGRCSRQFVVEGDGVVYPCDFYCIDAYAMGNINETDFSKLSETSVAVDFIEESLAVEDKCKACKYLRLCRNGCKRERIDVDKCDAYMQFFKYALVHLKNMS